MIDLGFAYYKIMSDDLSRVTSMIAELGVSDSPPQAVTWDVPKMVWRFSPRTAAYFLFDDRNSDRTTEVDRAEAERVARTELGTELPSDDELRRMCAEGMNRWDVKNDPDGLFID
jgi:hypothetical protein